MKLNPYNIVRLYILEKQASTACYSMPMAIIKLSTQIIGKGKRITCVHVSAVR